MKKSQVFVGTIKRCNNFYCYEKYGEEKYFADCRVGHTEFGTLSRYVDIIDEQAILIKVAEDEYIYLKSLKNPLEEILVDLKIYNKTITTYPSEDNELFVEEDTLVPYFENKDDKNIGVKSLKRTLLLDPRIKGGIEN